MYVVGVKVNPEHFLFKVGMVCNKRNCDGLVRTVTYLDSIVVFSKKDASCDVYD